MSNDISSGSSERATVDVERAWEALVTTALLGTDRREPPEPPAGPIADVVADLDVVLGESSPDVRFLNHLATVEVARRLAATPGPSAPPLAPPAGDERPLCSAAAVEQWRLLVDEWPVLEDEWLATVVSRDETVPGDVLVDLLERHRSDLRRRQLVQLVGGAVVAWVSDHLGWPTAPSLPADVDPCALPELAPHPALAAGVFASSGDELAGAVREVLAHPTFTAADRRLVEHVLARCAPAALDEVIATLESAVADGVAPAAAALLAALARRRRAMLASFERQEPA